MHEYLKYYINGDWVEPLVANPFEVINPATEQPCGRISLGTAADVDRAVAAAVRAFPDYAQTSVDERVALLEAILAGFDRRYDEIASIISEEMGAPRDFAREEQAACGPMHLGATIEALKSLPFSELSGNTRILREPIGPCALITPWNWPVNQVVAKVAPALAAGCTMVLKPSEIAPFDAMIFAEVLHDAGVPPGVFNLVNGDGPTVGAALAGHPDIAMISFTGSTRAGIDVANRAAPSVKRVAQELGGKSPNIILDDADLESAVSAGARACFDNSGQSCDAPTRMLVPKARMEEAAAIAADVANAIRVGDPNADGTDIGPVVSSVHWERIQAMIQAGIDEGAAVAAGGTGRPKGLETGYYVRPTVFAGVSNDMRIAREEIFGPVLSIIGYADEDDAVRIANDTPYGLASYVQSGSLERARRVASRIRAGMVYINGASAEPLAPFGGYKQSGNGREWGRYGIEEYLEVKSVYGDSPATG